MALPLDSASYLRPNNPGNLFFEFGELGEHGKNKLPLKKQNRN
jgi:hypothetical protein